MYQIISGPNIPTSPTFTPDSKLEALCWDTKKFGTGIVIS